MNYPTAEEILHVNRQQFVPIAGPILYWEWVVANRHNIVTAIKELGFEPPDFGPGFDARVQDMLRPYFDARSDAIRWLESFPLPQSWQKRDWLQCKRCGYIAYYDYQPYSLSSPILTFPCGHGLTQKLHEYTTKLDEETAKRLLIDQKIERILKS